jgi:hypothetical protein
MQTHTAASRRPEALKQNTEELSTGVKTKTKKE